MGRAGAHEPVQLQSYVPGVLFNFKLPLAASYGLVSILKWIQSNALGYSVNRLWVMQCPRMRRMGMETSRRQTRFRATVYEFQILDSL